MDMQLCMASYKQRKNIENSYMQCKYNTKSATHKAHFKFQSYNTDIVSLVYIFLPTNMTKNVFWTKLQTRKNMWHINHTTRMFTPDAF